MKQKIKIFSFLLLCIITLSLLNSCENESTCSSKIFKGNTEEEIFIISENDSLNIVIEQAYSYLNNDTIHQTVKYSEDKSEVVKLNLFVSYESYHEIPEFIKLVDNYRDTIFIWFSIRDKINKLSKINSILEVECTPIVEASVIDSIHIEFSESKNVSIIEKYGE